MLPELKFTKNPNGKLFSDVFGDIRLASYERYSPGSKFKIMLNKHEMGVAEVVGFKDFSLGKLTHCLSMMNCGQGAKHQAMLIHSYYKTAEREITKETMLMFVTFKWRWRNMPVQSVLMEDYWKAKIDDYPQIPTEA